MGRFCVDTVEPLCAAACTRDADAASLDFDRCALDERLEDKLREGNGERR